jgi:hypothetical protein
VNIKRKASHVLVAGRSGMGKTTYGERYLIGAHHKRVFIFDHQGEFAERLHVLPIFRFEDIRRRGETETILCYDYSREARGQLLEAFDAFCTEVFDICEFHLEPRGFDGLIVCDEIQKCIGDQSPPQSVKNIVQTGRRFGVDSLFLSQQPNRIHNEMREQVTELVLFSLQDENSLKFAKNMGKNVEEVQALKEHEYLWYNLHTGEERRGVVKHRA